jgi:murein DD-endopeptidase MepM/ murein hydrolase activator NlpD
MRSPASLFALFLVIFMTACGLLPTIYITDSDNSDEIGDIGGSDSAISSPFQDGNKRMCVQGYNGGYTHQGASTKHDLDFDTNNYEDEELYAPVSGVARVHTESATTNFGYHVNIDRGDSTYVVLAHLKQIFVKDGDEVAAGTLLGYEGCTGVCTGDHVHFGLHEGNAGLEAHYGTSIEGFYHLADATAEEEFENVSDTSLVCGLESMGDPKDGHWYDSDLPVALWHPDGTLIMSPKSPEVFVIENGERRWIVNEEVFWSLGYDFRNVVNVSDEELNCFGRGNDLNEYATVDAFVDEFGLYWLAVSDGTTNYRQQVSSLAWDKVMASWGLNYNTTNPPPSTNTYNAWPERAGYVAFRDGSLLKEESRSDVYAVTDGVAAPIFNWSVYLLAGYFGHDIITIPDGALRSIQGRVGDCEAGLYCITSQTLSTCGGGFDIADLGDWGGPNDTGEADDYGDTDEEIPCEDADHDGHCSEYSGGDDCWDYNPYVYPGAEEICGDGIDQDCDGMDEACPNDENDTSEESDADTDSDSDTDTDSDTDADADTDTDADTDSGGFGLMTVTWATDFGYNSNSLTAIYEFAPTSADFSTWASTSFSSSSASAITFSFMVPDGNAVRYSVEAYTYGAYDWSCESTSSSESTDRLMGTHTVNYFSPSGDFCSLTPTVYHKVAGVVDGCEALTEASCP